MAFTTDTELLDGGRLLPLVEDFYTIQGEGFHAGKPAYFIRLGGCDVGCRWCDAKYTWNPKLYPPTDVRTVIDRALACPAQAIVITGGEPLLYPLGVLTETLHETGLQICIRDRGMSVAQTAAASAGRSAGAGARAEGDRRERKRLRMGRAERRTGAAGVHALPAARMERRRTGDARDGRVRQGASEVEYLHTDA